MAKRLDMLDSSPTKAPNFGRIVTSVTQKHPFRPKQILFEILQHLDALKARAESQDDEEEINQSDSEGDPTKKLV